jgi:hypothetical protein
MVPDASHQRPQRNNIQATSPVLELLDLLRSIEARQRNQLVGLLAIFVITLIFSLDRPRTADII